MNENVSEEFKAVVLDWLKENKEPSAVTVTKVEAYGTDWAGDTVSGFYDRADVTIWYTSEDDKDNYVVITGEELGHLWGHVMTAWPVRADQ